MSLFPRLSILVPASQHVLAYIPVRAHYYPYEGLVNAAWYLYIWLHLYGWNKHNLFMIWKFFKQAPSFKAVSMTGVQLCLSGDLMLPTLQPSLSYSTIMLYSGKPAHEQDLNTMTMHKKCIGQDYAVQWQTCARANVNTMTKHKISLSTDHAVQRQSCACAKCKTMTKHTIWCLVEL